MTQNMFRTLKSPVTFSNVNHAGNPQAAALIADISAGPGCAATS